VNVQNLITQYGYLAVFLLMLLESACIPVPSEAIMMFGGAMAAGAVGHGHPSLIGIVAAGVLGNVAGSYIAWAVGKYAGQPAVHRWGRRIGVREHEIDRSTAWFERHGPVAVLLGRVVPVIRTFISLPAGFAGMPAVRFGVYTTLGCIPWTAALGIAGYALGANWDHVAKDFKAPTYGIAAVIVIGIIAVIVIRRRRNRAASGNAAQSAVGSGYQPMPMPGQPWDQRYQNHPAQPASQGQYGPPAPGGWQPAQTRRPASQAVDFDPRVAAMPQPAANPWGQPSDQQYR
jgi:membrane protein DedA with SNARE-associated domain